MNKVTRNIAVLIAVGTTSIGFAQVTQQKIGNNPTLINPNAALEVESTDKGILLPRVGLTATNSFAPLSAHVAGMTVYNTATAGTEPNNVTPGYYYNDGTQWVRIAAKTDINPVNIYNANGSLTNDRRVTLNGNNLRFTSPDRDIYFDNNGRIGVEAKGANDADIYLSSGSGTDYSRLDIQSFPGPGGQVNLTATGAAEQMTIATHMTTVSAPILFSTSAGNNALGTEKMRITGTGNVGVNTPDPTEKFDNDGITRLRNLPTNGATNAINTTVDGDASAAQDQTFTATRTVVADANGVLGTVAGLPSAPVNIYTNDGTLTANRTVTTGSNFLRFAGNGSTVTVTNTATQGRLAAFGPNRGSIGIDGGSGATNSSLELYADANNLAQINTSGSGSTGLSIGTTTVTPLTFKTDGASRMTVTSTGEVAIGATTAPSFVIGSTTIQPKLHVAGDISTTGKLYTTNSVYADYVFEKYFKGHSDLNNDYKFSSLEEVNDFIKKNHHLPGVTKIDDLVKSEEGYTFDMTALSIQQLEKIEELFLHTIEQQAQLKAQYEVNEKQQQLILQQQDELQQLKERMQKLEQLLNIKQ